MEYKDFTWRAHPARERLGAAVAASVIIFTIATTIYISFQSFTWSILALFVLLFALNRFYFPSRFVINREGISAHYPFKRQRYCWKDIHRFVDDKYGGYFSTSKRSSRMDAYRGMNILFGQQREDVIKLIREHIREVERS